MPDVRAVTKHEEITVGGTMYVVGEACPERVGQWYCAEHNAGPFRHNMAKDTHIASVVADKELGQCVMVWWCIVHGPEEPGYQIDRPEETPEPKQATSKKGKQQQ